MLARFLGLSLLIPVYLASLGEIKYFEASEMTRAKFESLMMKGEVAVIRGASSFWPLSNWSCGQFRKSPHMKGFKVERVYGEGDGTFVPLCSTCEEWENDQRPSLNDDESGPSFAPVYWDVKGDKASIEVIDSLTPPWPFLSKANHFWKREAAELWFSPPNAGAKYHIDGHVQTTVVSQMVGTRRWRLALVPEGDGSLFPNHLDSNEFEWTPELTITLETGDLLMFPPGTIHDTLNMGESCAVSVTHQIGIPYPSTFYRRNMRRLLGIADTRETWPVIADLASFGFLRPRVTISSPFFETDEKMLSHIVPSYDESNPFDFFAGIHDWFITKGLVGPFGSRRMSEYLGFHDVDEDGLISRSEFVESAMEWLLFETALINSIPSKFRPTRYFYQQMENVMSQSYWTEARVRDEL